MILKLGMQKRVLEFYQVCSNDDPVLTLTYFTAVLTLTYFTTVMTKVVPWDCSIKTNKLNIYLVMQLVNVIH